MSPTPLILGHRGASAVAPENTLAAFARAVEDGADGIEFDVRLSSDHVPVVIHDATLKRTGRDARLVQELTAAELQRIDVGSWFTASGLNHRGVPSYLGEKLPTLAQVFELFSSNKGVLYVEMKCEIGEGPNLAKAVVKLILESGIQDRVVVESFDLEAIVEIKKNNTAIRTAALFEPRLTRPFSSVRRLRMIDLATEHGADEIALHHTLAAPRVVEKAKGAGLDIVVWTVDTPEWIPRADSMGIKALIANHPAAMVQYRNNSDVR